MKKVVLFGVLDTAELAHYYLTHDSDYEVVAFTVHKKYPETDRFKDLPVVDFETLEKHYPPSRYALFGPMTGRKMNTIRARAEQQGKQKGHSFMSYIRSR